MPATDTPSPALPAPPLGAPAASTRHSGRARLSWQREILLALMPTATVVLMLWLLEQLSNQRLLFASLASSAFLIYLDPAHPTNSARTLVVAQMSAALAGFACLHLLGPGYAPAAVAMAITIGVMVTLDVMHPPAVATALNFAFRAGAAENNLLLFGLAVGLVVVLVALQRIAAFALRRFEGAPHPAPPGST